LALDLYFELEENKITFQLKNQKTQSCKEKIFAALRLRFKSLYLSRQQKELLHRP